ncbi:MAG: hypothetical protein QOF14_5414 [Hyphomicrobiales bacterium]|jgi:hypothetical protein|nr:hypothetical protein [Hyphomicrobiales bacterium]
MQTNPVRRVEWTVRPIEGQKIVRRCPGCETKRSFVSSGAFRVNAHKKLIDVWHIYKCERCDYTWNVDVIARTNRRQIDPDLYDLFLQNDEGEARRRTFDYKLLAHNRAELGDPPDFVVEGAELDELDETGRAHIHLTFEFLLPIRLASMFAKKLGLSRKRLNDLIAAGHLIGVSSDDLPKRIKGPIDFEIDIAQVRATLAEHRRVQKAEAEAFERRQAGQEIDTQ